MTDAAGNSSDRSALRLRLLAFSALCVAAVAGVVIYAQRQPETERAPSTAEATVIEDPERLAEVRRRPHLLFRNMQPGPYLGRMMAITLDDPRGARYATPFTCDRIYATSTGGAYLQSVRAPSSVHDCVLFDHDLRERFRVRRPGIPNRARISPDGRFLAETAFVAGDSYSVSGFSTRTILIDLTTGTVNCDLETFAVKRDGTALRSPDFNFWGVTFASGSDHFYATLHTEGSNFLVEGEIGLREMRVIRSEVECPSLSSDGTRIAYKWRTSKNGLIKWRLCVLDTSTLEQHFAAETRSVDDQPEWFDDEQLLYAISRYVDGRQSSNIWIVRADGSGAPRLFVADASSPCVIRP